MWSNSQPSNMLPTSLLSVNRLSKKLHDTNVQFTNAALWWVEALSGRAGMCIR